MKAKSRHNPLNTKLTYLLVVISFFGCKSTPDTEQAKVNKILPALMELTGIKHPDTVKVELLKVSELKQFFKNSVDVDYPNDELTKCGECFSEIGLLPRDYDFKSELLRLAGEASAAIYDARAKTIKMVSDLSVQDRGKLSDEMIIVHEATHALEDGIIDINKQSENGLKNIDYDYTFRALSEGVASVVMFSYKDKLPLSELHNVKKFWERGAIGPSFRYNAFRDRYLYEYWGRPYLDGCDFVEAWLKANPYKKLIDLFKDMPSTSEQILHFDKYVTRDEPTQINLSKVRAILPKNWKMYYSNTLGEFELLTLFESYHETIYGADSLAAGWDGCKFEGYKDKNNNLILLGSSAWDTEKDAQEFCTGFKTVLKMIRITQDFNVEQHQNRVDFVIGLADKVLAVKIMSVLQKPS
jgi:hypothetical protein